VRAADFDLELRRLPSRDSASSLFRVLMRSASLPHHCSRIFGISNNVELDAMLKKKDERGESSRLPFTETLNSPPHFEGRRGLQEVDNLLAMTQQIRVPGKLRGISAGAN